MKQTYNGTTMENPGGRHSDVTRPLVMVCLSASPSSRRVIRAAARMVYPEGAPRILYDDSGYPAAFPTEIPEVSPAAPSGPASAAAAASSRGAYSPAQNAGVPVPIALYVGSSGREADEDSRLRENIQYAREHGFEVHTIRGTDIPLAISEYARREGVTDLFLGYSPPSFFLQTRTPINEKLLSYLPTVDIHIIPDPVSSPYADAMRKKTRPAPVWNPQDLFLVLGVMAVATLLSGWFYLSRFSNSNIITIYILAVLIASVMTSSRIYGTLAAVLYVLLFNFLFIEPRFTLLVYDSAYLMTYLVTVVAALITGTVAVRLKNIARVSAENAYQAKVLLDTSNQLESAADSSAVMRTTCMQLVHLLNRAVVFFPGSSFFPENSDPRLFPAGEKTISAQQMEDEKDAVRWAMENSHQAGAFTSHFEDCSCRYLSLFFGEHCYGVVGIDMEGRPFTEFENTILLSILHEGTMALENKRIMQEQQKAEIRAENERLRAGLLRSISHDLRTPLTSIYGNASNLHSHETDLPRQDRDKIYEDIMEDASWLSAQFENILAMTRLESGLGIRKTIENMEDVIEESLRHLPAHPAHQIVFTPGDPSDPLPLVRMDPRLIMQVLINLLGNAVKYTPDGTTVEVRLLHERGDIVVEVADNGPGIPDEDKPHIFELFYAGRHSLSDGCRSMGIGLNLCSQILRAHEGTIEVFDNTPAGAVFRFRLPAADLADIDPEYLSAGS